SPATVGRRRRGRTPRHGNRGSQAATTHQGWRGSPRQSQTVSWTQRSIRTSRISGRPFARQVAPDAIRAAQKGGSNFAREGPGISPGPLGGAGGNRTLVRQVVLDRDTTIP